MKKITHIVGYCVLAMILTSCYYFLREKDIQYINSYQGNEILVFQSDRNRMDTIFLKGTEKFMRSGVSLKANDGFRLIYTKERDDEMEFGGKSFIEIDVTQKTPDIKFDGTILKDSWFYGINLGNTISLAEFKKMPNTELTIGDKIYSDVKVFEAGDYAKRYEYRDNYAERFYWSVSEVFLGLDKRDEKWRLIEKYIP